MLPAAGGAAGQPHTSALQPPLQGGIRSKYLGKKGYRHGGEGQGWDPLPGPQGSEPVRDVMTGSSQMGMLPRLAPRSKVDFLVRDGPPGPETYTSQPGQNALSLTYTGRPG